METALAPASTTTSVSPASLPADFDIGKWAAEVDAGRDTAPPADEPAPEQPGEGTPAPAAPSAQPGKGKPAETTTKKDAPGSEPPTDAKAGETASESAYTKAQKEAARRDKSWKALDEEKAKFRQEQATLTQQVDTLKRELAQLRSTVPAAPAKDEHGATAETYERLARRYADEGNDEMAEAARARADKLRRQTPAATTPEPTGPQAEHWKTPQFQQEWQQQTQAMIAADPSLNDPANPVLKATNTLLQDPEWAPYFLSRPQGIRAAVEVARLVEKSAKIDAITKELETVRAENQRLQKLTSPRGSHPAAPPNGAKSITDMGDEEARAEIRRLAAAADRGEI